MLISTSLLVVQVVMVAKKLTRFYRQISQLRRMTLRYDVKEQKTLKHRQKNLIICLQALYIEPHTKIFLIPLYVRFYTGLPSYEVLMVVFDHVAPHVSRRLGSTALNRFEEFVMVLMKLCLNVPFQDLAYRFVLSLSSVSRIFTSWIIALDVRLFYFIHWPDREQLWKTMPMCFQYTFGRKVTVIIDCFEVFIDKPINLMARAQTFSYKHHTIKVLIGITP